MGALLTSWKTAKKTFETRTGKKKPSAKIGPIRKGTGIEDALKKLENAKNARDFDKAMDTFRKKKDAYQKLCKDAMSDRDSQDYKNELNALVVELESLEADAQGTRGKLPA